MIFTDTDEFKKEYKKLLKKYPSLCDDLNLLKDVLWDDPLGKELPKEHIVPISGLWEDIWGKFYKVRRFLCKSLRSKTDIRVVYKYIDEERKIEFQEIKFIEIFHKNQKENHNISRIKKY